MSLRGFSQDGFEIIENVFSPDEVRRWIEISEVDLSKSGTRAILDTEWGREIAANPRLNILARDALGMPVFAVRATWFQKTTETNWALGWHQDTKIAVKSRKEVPGFSNWSIKEGIHHVLPSPEILQNMVAARISLDQINEENGALRMLPGSHKMGKLNAGEAAGMLECSTTCAPESGAGDVILMHPLTLHSSARSQVDRPRRVLHIEFAGIELPYGLEWRWRI